MGFGVWGVGFGSWGWGVEDWELVFRGTSVLGGGGWRLGVGGWRLGVGVEGYLRPWRGCAWWGCAWPRPPGGTHSLSHSLSATLSQPLSLSHSLPASLSQPLSVSHSLRHSLTPSDTLRESADVPLLRQSGAERLVQPATLYARQTLDYESFTKSQLAQTKLTSRPDLAYIWSRYPQNPRQRNLLGCMV